VQAASTGVIGEPLPMECLRRGIPELAAALRPAGFDDLARAMMTTDTEPKRISRTGKAGGRPYTLTAVAKGAGMIRPDMATMLCFVATDIDLEAAALSAAVLKRAVDHSFNRITIDGDTSTNDTVLLMANGHVRGAP
jgi:glutamate N-acetyltransferase/amino-acid N-acetyltransferase